MTDTFNAWLLLYVVYVICYIYMDLVETMAYVFRKRQSLKNQVFCSVRQFLFVNIYGRFE